MRMRLRENTLSDGSKTWDLSLYLSWESAENPIPVWSVLALSAATETEAVLQAFKLKDAIDSVGLSPIKFEDDLYYTSK